MRRHCGPNAFKQLGVAPAGPVAKPRQLLEHDGVGCCQRHPRDRSLRMFGSGACLRKLRMETIRVAPVVLVVTAGGVVSGGPLTISKGDAPTDETGKLTPSRTVTRILAVVVGHPGTFQSKLRAFPSSEAIGLYDAPSGENSTF